MKFFKYLVFFLFSIISINSYASQKWFYSTIYGESKGSFDRDAACLLLGKLRYENDDGSNVRLNSSTDSSCNVIYYSKSYAGNRSGSVPYFTFILKESECWYPDYKIVTQPITGQLKKSICIPNNGVMCKYTTSSIDNLPIVNGSITTTFSSVSKTPAVNCKEELLNPPCDPKDPYGGCYTPPNQECTRQFDGSIVCPEEKKPPIQQGCNGADYCKLMWFR